MNIKVVSTRIILLITLLFSLAKFAVSAEVSPAEKVVKDFYHVYLNDDSKDNAQLLEKYISENVLKSINESSLCDYDSAVLTAEHEKLCAQERECKEYKGDYICNWNGIWLETDVNYFTKSQDIFPSWSNHIEIIPVEQQFDHAIYYVSLGEKPDPVMKLRVTLEPINNEWKIISVSNASPDSDISSP